MTSTGGNRSAQRPHYVIDTKLHPMLLIYSKWLQTISIFADTNEEPRTGSGGRAVERLAVNRGDGGSIPPTAVSKRRQFRSPHICLRLSEETLTVLYIWCLCQGSKISHTGRKCVTCSGLTNALQRAPSSIWENERKRKGRRGHNCAV